MGKMKDLIADEWDRAYRQGYDAALDACIAAVREAIGEEWQGRIIPWSQYDCCGCSSYSSIVDDATDAINVLREEKL